MDVISESSEPAHAVAASSGAQSDGGATVLTQAVRWQPAALAPPPRAHQPRNPSLPTFVGLIILILTFFIVLTSISLHDQSRSEAAIASVQVAFGNAVAAEDVAARPDEEIARNYIAGLTRRIQSLMPLMGGKKGPAADHQVLWLPLELAFPGEDATLASMFPTILREVVNALDDIPRRLTPAIEMRLCAAEPSDLLRARAMAIGAALEAEGAPLRRFSIGMARCEPTRIGIAVALTPAREEQAE